MMIDYVHQGQKITASQTNALIDEVNSLVDDKSRSTRNKSFRNLRDNNAPHFLETRSSLLSGFGQNTQVYLGQNTNFAKNLIRVNHQPVNQIYILSGDTWKILFDRDFWTNGEGNYYDGFVNTQLSGDLKLGFAKIRAAFGRKQNIAYIGDGSLPTSPSILSILQNYTPEPILLQSNNYFGQNRAVKHGHIGMVDIAEISATAISCDTDATENQKSIEFNETEDNEEYLQLYNFDKLSAVISTDLSSLSSLNDISADILLRQLSSNDNIILNYIPLSTIFAKVDTEGLSSKSIERDLSSNELRLFDFLDPDSLSVTNDDDKVLLRRVIDDIPTLKYVDLSSIILSSAIISGDSNVIDDKSITYVKNENDQYYQLYDWHADKTNVALSDAILYRHDNELRYGYLSSVNFLGDEKAIHTNLSAGKHELRDWNLSNKIDLSAIVKQGGNLSANNWNSLSTPDNTKVEFLVRQAPNAQSNAYTLKYASLKINLQNPTLSTNVDTAISTALPDVKTKSIDKKLSAIENENVAYLQLHNFDLNAPEISANLSTDATHSGETISLDDYLPDDWYYNNRIKIFPVLQDADGEIPVSAVNILVRHKTDNGSELKYVDVNQLSAPTVPWVPSDSTGLYDDPFGGGWEQYHTKSIQHSQEDGYQTLQLYNFDKDITADNTPAKFDPNIVFAGAGGVNVNDYLNAVDPQEVLVPLKQEHKDGPGEVDAEVLMRQKSYMNHQGELMKGTISTILPDFVGSDTVKTEGDYQSLDVVANTSLKDSYWQLHNFGVAGEELQPEDLSDYNFVCWKSNNGKYELEHRPIDIDALYEGLSGEISGIAGRIIAEVSGEISGDYWPQGGYYEDCYGSSIGRSDKKVVIDLDNQTLWPAGYGSEASSMIWTCEADFNILMGLSVAYNAYFKRNVDISGNLSVAKNSYFKQNADVSGNLSVGGSAYINQLGISALSTDAIRPFSAWNAQLSIMHNSTLFKGAIQGTSIYLNYFKAYNNAAVFGADNQEHVGWYDDHFGPFFFINYPAKLQFLDAQSNEYNLDYTHAQKLIRLCNMLSSEQKWQKLEQLLNS